MGVTDWDHNSWYHRLLLRQVPDGAQRVLDVGCGAGTLARRLAETVPHVDAFDRSAEMIDAARSVAPPNLSLRVADAPTVDLPAASYDAVLSVAVLHHLPLDEALPRMAAWLRPGASSPRWPSPPATCPTSCRWSWQRRSATTPSGSPSAACAR